MRGTIRTAIVLAWMICAPAWAAGGYVYEAGGEVSIASGKAVARPAVKNHTITSNTLISTGDNSHAVLKFEDGQVVAMQANSTFNVREYRFEPQRAEKSNILFSKLRGGLLFVTGLIGQRSKKSFRLTTPNATIGIRGTEFMLVMVDDILYGKVLSGSVAMTNKAGMAHFDAGQTLRVTSPTALPQAIPAEELPAGLFSQLEALPIPPAVPEPLPVAAADAVPALAPDAALNITGSALLSGAAAVAGGASIQAIMSSLLPGASAAGLLAVAGAVPLPSAGAVPSVLASPALTPVPVLTPGIGDPAGIAAASVVAPTEPVIAKRAPTPARANPAYGDPILFGRHNFTQDRVGTGEICVFCHTPQGSEEEVAAPLWNRTESPLGGYKAFSSVGSATDAATASVSIACLSCHDGTQAPNVVQNSPAGFVSLYPPENAPVEVSIKNYLKDHHPVSMLYGGGGMSDKQPDAPVDALLSFNDVDYDAAIVRLLTADNDVTSRGSRFRDVRSDPNQPILLNIADFNRAEHSGSGSGTVWWLESKGTGKGRQKSDFYLYTRADTVDGVTMNRPYVECSSCHDPHSPNTTFLRINNRGSAVCLTCHAK